MITLPSYLSEWAAELISPDALGRRKDADKIRAEIVTHLKHYFSLPLRLVFVEDSQRQGCCHPNLTHELKLVLEIMRRFVKAFGFFWHTVSHLSTKSLDDYGSHTFKSN